MSIQREKLHTVRSYEQELEQMRDMMRRMGNIVQKQVEKAVIAVTEHDEGAAQLACGLDPEVDALERDVEALAIRLLALRSPVAGDLREIVAALKITGDLERIGDYAASIARRSTRFDLSGRSISLSGMRGMGRLVEENLSGALESMAQRDAEAANDVWRADLSVDEYYTAMFREFVTYMMEDPRNIGPCTHLLFIAKNMERIGDHTTNVAERIYYAVKGENLPSVRPRGDSAQQDVLLDKE